jgi:predicted nucleic-acid-binding protein
MIGLDTNVIVRYITQDDPKQSPLANNLIEEQLTPRDPGFITLLTLVEITWVLESCYDQNKQDVLTIVNNILTTRQFLVEKADIAYLALKRCLGKSKADFSDALIAVLCEQNGCEKVLTFDKKARSVGMEVVASQH